ncbi:transmembrane protein 145-like isoform X1 [Ruditapes philippinarum]|uniref:transmembrane protein 145-like isoform X1 n=1 Tax=Ruditapes philippinarum TaxID=129788 RepID=UPI00295BF8A6|nr:transmembrane protein 145-like isoform X1 [Ruditapes philippinarum]
MARTLFCALFTVLCLVITSSHGKYVEGEINTLQDWEFITRFCFLSAKGTLRFTFEYPITYGPQHILLYYDTPDQWDAVYKSDKNCSQRMAVMNPANNQIITLDTNQCKIQTIDGMQKYNCTDERRFIAARERWWYIAAAHCRPLTPIGINLKYKIHMTNGAEDDYLHREYSADEFYILPIDIAFLIAYVVLCILSIICAVFLRNRQLWHTTYKMYMVSVFLWTFYLFLMSVGYGIYGNDGLEWKLRSTKYAARAFESISIMIFLLMLILIGKGYTITRGKLSMASTVKISVFMTLYAIVYVIIFVWEAIIFDPGLVLYLYESPPGYALIAMRIIGFVWFCYAIFFTLKHYPEKGSFYYPLFVFYTLWFWAGPLMIVIATYAIALWSREKTVVGVENFVALCGHIYFMVLTRPSAANKNFPYHVRTTQIGILQNVPHQMGSGAPDANDTSYGGHAYAVSNPMQGSSSGPDLTSLFVTSQTKSDKERESETSLSYNNNSNGTDLPPEYNSFPIASAPPPSYQDMFRARPSISE